LFFFFSSRRRHTRFDCDWSSDVCSSDLVLALVSDRAPAWDPASAPALVPGSEQEPAWARALGQGRAPVPALAWARASVPAPEWVPALAWARARASVSALARADRPEELCCRRRQARGLPGRPEP